MATKKGRIVRPPKSVEVKYRKGLYLFVDDMRRETNTNIKRVLRDYESEYVRDDYADALSVAIDALRRRYEGLAEQYAVLLANQFVSGVNSETRQRFRRSVENIVGVDVSGLVENEGLSAILKAEVKQNVSLIRSIPQSYFKTIESIVYGGTITGNRSQSMIDEILNLGHSTRKRARLIARDQTSKLTSGLIQQRQQNLGVTHYIWVTAQDGDRVRPTHREKNGKVFAWNSPPKDTGHPGHDINCRCIAQPIFNL